MPRRPREVSLPEASPVDTDALRQQFESHLADWETMDTRHADKGTPDVCVFVLLAFVLTGEVTLGCTAVCTTSSSIRVGLLICAVRRALQPTV